MGDTPGAAEHNAQPMLASVPHAWECTLFVGHSPPTSTTLEALVPCSSTFQAPL